jgi:2-polyprenyl-3-methyl-5-hydroxy-6-metoxy-1,4-benzoquinol methylase
MSNLQAAERAKYEEMWAVPGYDQNSPGEAVLPVFLDMARPPRGSTILDAGCGSGKAGVALRAIGFEVQLCDLTPDGLVAAARDLPFTTVCLWDDLRSQLNYAMGGAFDFVYCTDVLEHIPEALTMLTVSRLLAVARKGVFLNISTVSDTHGVWIGQTLHQTVKPFVVWRDWLSTTGTLVEGRDLLMSAAFLVKP